MPDGDWDAGLIDFDWDPNTYDFTSTIDPVSIGQAYYDLGPETEYGSAIFWWDMMQEFLPYGHCSGEDCENISWNDWMYNYGDYLPQDYGAGLSELARNKRLGQQGQSIMHKEYEGTLAEERFKGGHSGFASSGMQSQIGRDLWTNYTNQAQARNMNMQEMEESIYAEHGQNILDQLANLGSQGAFSPPDPDDELESNYMDSSILGEGGWQESEGEWGDAIYYYCLNNCGGTGNDAIGNDPYCSMCTGYSSADLG